MPAQQCYIERKIQLNKRYAFCTEFNNLVSLKYKLCSLETLTYRIKTYGCNDTSI